MVFSRRDICRLLPQLTALVGSTATKSFPAEDSVLSSKAYCFEDLPVRRNEQNASRPVLEGETHSGWHIELHESDLQPGAMPHAPHHHVHEEMFLVREGALEVTIAGRTSRLGPGSVAFVASNDEHGHTSQHP
jgi:mannose-6-phosphate isomerase-like protein (cupin superfamily)